MDKTPGSWMASLLERLVAGYHADDRTHRIGETFLPSRARIVEIIGLARRLIFPGFFDEKRLTNENVSLHAGGLLLLLSDAVTDQICHCFCTRQFCETCGGVSPCRDNSRGVTARFLERIPTIREALALDAQAAFDGDPAAKTIQEVIYCYPGFYAVTCYRIARELHNLGIPLMPRIMTEHAHSVTGADIHPGAEIGASFFIDHATGVVVGETTKIGDNVKIYQGVTLGAMSFPKDERGRAIKGLKRHPTIESNVTIYANATILGGDTVIGEGVTVPGNAFVTRSVNADSVMAAQAPGRRVKSKRSRKEAD